MIATLEKIIAKGASISAIGAAISGLCGYAVLLVLTKILDTTQLGYYFLGFGVLSIVVLLAQAGLDAAAMHYVSTYRTNNKPARVRAVAARALKTSFFLGLTLGITQYFTASDISRAFFNDAGVASTIKAFSVGVPFAATLAIAIAILRGLLQVNRAASVGNIIQPMMRLALTAALCSMGFGLQGAIGATLLSTGFALILAIYYLNNTTKLLTIPQKNTTETEPIYAYSFSLFMTNLTGASFIWADVLITGYLVTPGDVAIYRVAAQLAFVLTMVSSAFSAIFAPVISELNSRGDVDQLNRLFKKVTTWTAHLATPVVVVFIVFSTEILRIFGDQYEAAAVPLAVLAFSHWLLIVIGEVGWPLALCGWQHIWVRLNVIMALLNIVVNFVLITDFGITGAAIATSACLILLRFAGLVAVIRCVRISPIEVANIRIWAYGGVVFVAALVFKQVYDSSGYLYLPCAMIFVATFYSSTVYIFETLVKRRGGTQKL